jgi:hypothetical protein
MAGARVVFTPTGEAEIFGLADNSIQVASDDGSPCHEIEINESTSRVRIVTGYDNVC